jgi:hypothetical protein
MCTPFPEKEDLYVLTKYLVPPLVVTAQYLARSATPGDPPAPCSSQRNRFVAGAGCGLWVVMIETRGTSSRIALREETAALLGSQ